MIYSLSLEYALILVGVLLVAGHLLAMVAEERCKWFLRAFPRNGYWGNVLYTVAAVWFAGLVQWTDLGEFSSMRRGLLLATIIAFVAGLRWMREFLAVRALGMVLLLGAEPLLESAWMRPEGGRLLLVGLVYAWILSGLFFVGMPYVMRDAVAWVTAERTRWRLMSLAGMIYGLALLGVRLKGLQS